MAKLFAFSANNSRRRLNSLDYADIIIIVGSSERNPMF